MEKRRSYTSLFQFEEVIEDVDGGGVSFGQSGLYVFDDSVNRVSSVVDSNHPCICSEAQVLHKKLDGEQVGVYLHEVGGGGPEAARYSKGSLSLSACQSICCSY